ncbi:MAG TPA: phosphonate ABC transporter, permease protein PhnE [Anaerolineae bacterium]|nr:phosphonate ABC transporter, permease protein PhnE [Anaerolineae bacterium]
MTAQNGRGGTVPPRPGISPLVAALLSLVVPGSGQFLLGKRQRGLGFFLAIAILGALILALGAAALLAPLVLLWLWAGLDAYRLAAGRPAGITVPVLLAVLIFYGLGVQVVEVRPERLVGGYSAMRPFLTALTQPELLEYPTEDRLGFVPFQVPCVEPLPPVTRQASTDPRITTNVPCAAVGETIQLTGEGFFPNFEGDLLWVNPIGDVQRVLEGGQPLRFQTDEEGRFQIEFAVPLAVPLTQLPEEGQTQAHLIRALQQRPFGTPQPTQTLSLVLEKIGETIALAFMATVLGMILALPISFLAARNLMGGNPVTRAIYTVVRALLNIVRSIETLMWAIVFVVWVGVGPFGGMLALALHTIAALGKLYSEAIESIDPGPIEAIRATGASFPQMVVYGVLPQIVPTFLSFTLYRWDINVRLSTVIGLVSDAGLGFLVIQWIRLNRLRSMATAIIAIVLVVAILDYVSGYLRERVIAGTPAGRGPGPLRRAVTTVVLLALFVAAFAWSWNVSEIEPVELVRGARGGMRMLGEFAVPDLFTLPSEERTVSATLSVPCGAVDILPAEESGPRVELSTTCGEVGDPLIIRGRDLPPNTEVSVRWAFEDAYLRVHRNCCVTDGEGSLEWETSIHPLLELDPEAAEAQPGRVVITWREEGGLPRFSDSFKEVMRLSLVTLLMALLATTLGTLFAVPLSFLAASNVMGRTPIGRGIYFLFRTLFNLSRSVEPLILALIASAWVGIGPFAGVLALAANNIPNLGKLFSESIEEIDRGPVEAITATGAGRLQVLAFAFVPQIVPKFLAFILYQWDINIRMSTVIGYVGGGGIGQFFRINVQLNQYDAAGMAVYAIVLMVWSMDWLSAKARERLV